MRLVFTADVHYDLGRESLRDELEILRRGVIASRPDVFVLGGDQVGLGRKHLPALLDGYRELECPKQARKNKLNKFHERGRS